MKYPLNSLIMMVSTAALLAAGPVPARADETNDARQPPKTERKVFFFEGGNPIDFVLAMDKHFRTRLGQILSIPSSLARAHVPKMKIATEKPEDALQVYNHIQDPLLGQWRYTGPAGEPWDPSVLALVPDKEVALRKGGARVKALSLAGLHKASWERVQDDIAAATKLGAMTAEKIGGEGCEGNIHIQPESKVLIAAGSQSYIEMVESVLAAHRANAQAGEPKTEPK